MPPSHRRPDSLDVHSGSPSGPPWPGVADRPGPRQPGPGRGGQGEQPPCLSVGAETRRRRARGRRGRRGAGRTIPLSVGRGTPPRWPPGGSCPWPPSPSPRPGRPAPFDFLNRLFGRCSFILLYNGYKRAFASLTSPSGRALDGARAPGRTPLGQLLPDRRGCSTGDPRLGRPTTAPRPVGRSTGDPRLGRPTSRGSLPVRRVQAQVARGVGRTGNVGAHRRVAGLARGTSRVGAGGERVRPRCGVQPRPPLQRRPPPRRR